MYVVFKVSPTDWLGIRELVSTFETEQEALDFCAEHDWKLRDENDFVWELICDEG